MATSKPAPKKTKQGKTLRKAKKLEATKPLAVNAFIKIDGVSGR